MPCKKITGAEVATPEPPSTRSLIKIFNVLKLAVLLLLTSIASAQSVQTIDSAEQLASALCQDPADERRSERLSNTNEQFVNVRLWNELLNCALAAPHSQSQTKSLAILKLTLRVGERLNNPELIATTYYYLGRTYSRMNDFENSVQAYETSRTLFEQSAIEGSLIYVLADLGATYLMVEEYEKAQHYSERSLAIVGQTISGSTTETLGPIGYGRARALHTLGEIDLRHGNHAAAFNKLREALALYERLKGSGSLYDVLMSQVLVALAKVGSEMGNYGDAFAYLTKAHQVSKNSGDHQTRANILRGQASLFLEQEDYAAARTYLNASLPIYRRLGNTKEELRVLLNLAVIEQQQGHHDDALQLFQRTLEAATSAKLVDVQIAAGEGLGVVLTAKRDFLDAVHAINQGLEIARRVNAKTHESLLLWRAAQTYYAMQNYRESAKLAEQALTLGHSLRLPKLTYFATAALGEAYAADGNVELAITTLKQAIHEIEEMRDEVAARREGQVLFFENKVGPYRTLVKLLTKEGKNFEALLYAERAKARILQEAVRKNAADLGNIYTEGEKAQAEFLINKLHGINQRIKSQTGGGEPKDELQNELNSVRRELVTFQERLAAAHPELLLRVGPAKSLTHADLTSLIPRNDFAFLEYVITGDNVGLFVVKQDEATAKFDVKYIVLPVTADELRGKVNEFHSALAERHPGYDPLGRELYRLLIEPVAEELRNIRTICIIPDEFLWSLPFQALTTTRRKYVLEEYSVYYAPSLSVLKEITFRRPQRTSDESLIAFGNPAIERGKKLELSLQPIPDAAAEVAAVAAAVGTHSKRVFIGRQAEEKTFKALAPQYATIHLATHGVLDNRDPLNSYLVLKKSDDNTEDDGLLKAREIVDMHLDADLTVLSACATGNGRISPGEGVIGMSWAFLVAGSRSVVVSQWRVNSASTSQLMKNFYLELARQKDLRGLNKSQALKEASLRLLKDRRYRHPFYWAGFVLVSSN